MVFQHLQSWCQFQREMMEMPSRSSGEGRTLWDRRLRHIESLVLPVRLPCSFHRGWGGGDGSCLLWSALTAKGSEWDTLEQSTLSQLLLGVKNYGGAFGVSVTTLPMFSFERWVRCESRCSHAVKPGLWKGRRETGEEKRLIQAKSRVQRRAPFSSHQSSLVGPGKHWQCTSCLWNHVGE